MQFRALIVLSVAVLAACSDSNGNDDDDETRPMDELGILRLGDDSPPLLNPVQSFYAKFGEDRVGSGSSSMNGQRACPGDEYLRLLIDDATLLAYPDGTSSPRRIRC